MRHMCSLRRVQMTLYQLITEAKRDEIINVFSEGSQQEKTKAVNIMKQIDPSKSSQYDAILQGGSKKG